MDNQIIPDLRCPACLRWLAWIEDGRDHPTDWVVCRQCRIKKETKNE